MSTTAQYAQLDAWIDAHFDEQVAFLQALVQVPTDTPPGNNAPHAERTAELLHAFGYPAEKHAVPSDEVKAYGLESLTNLIVRRKFAEGGKTIARTSQCRRSTSRRTGSVRRPCRDRRNDFFATCR